MLGYATRLQRDLVRWRDQGWITPEQQQRLAADAKAQVGFSAGSVLAILGAVLLCLAVLTFVAANWEALPKIARLGLLIGGLWLAYTLAYGLFRTGHDNLAEAMLLVAGGAFGAGIMLIAQTYHVSGNPPDAVLLWGVGVFLAAILLASTPSLVFAIVLLVVWLIIGEMEQPTVPAWQYLTAWALCAIAVVRHTSPIALHALMLALIAFLLREYVHEAVPPGSLSLYGLAFYILGRAVSLQTEAEARNTSLFPTLSTYGALLCLGDLMLLQLADDVFLNATRAGADVIGWGGLAAVLAAVAYAFWQSSFSIFTILAMVVYAALLRSLAPPLLGPVADPAVFKVLLSVVILLGSLWLITDGGRNGLRSYSSIGYVFFLGELFYIYFKTFGGLLETAMFYLFAGLLLIAMSTLFVVMERRKARRVEA